MGEQQAQRAAGAARGGEAGARVGAEQPSLSDQLAEAERERALAVARAMAPVFEQMRRAFADMARVAGPAVARIGEQMRRASQAAQSDYALAPPRPGGARGPGRRGRAAQRSPYGPQRRR